MADFNRFAMASVYYGLTIAAGEMGSSRYVSVMFSTLVELPCYVVGLFTVENKW